MMLKLVLYKSMFKDSALEGCGKRCEVESKCILTSGHATAFS